jgi:hypothetical protein
MKRFLSAVVLIIIFGAAQAQNWTEDLSISKKTPLPFDLDYKAEFDPTVIRQDWMLDSAFTNEWIFERDSASFHVYTKDGLIDGFMLVVTGSSETAVDKSFQSALAQFEKKLGKSSEEIGKYLWMIKLEENSYFLSLQSLIPYQQKAWTLNVHVFQ